MNNDFLRVNAHDEEEGVVEGEYCSAGEAKNEEKQKKLTLFKLLSYSFSKNGDALFVEKLPKMGSVFSMFIITLVTVVVLSLIAFIATDCALLIIAGSVASLVLPLFSIMFFYEMNTLKNVTLGEVMGALVMGVLFFVLMRFLSGYIYKWLYGFEWLIGVFGTVVSDLTLFFISVFYVKICKKDHFLAAILIVVSVYAGYVVANTLTNIFDSLYVTIRMNVSGSTVKNVLAIVNEGEYFPKIIASFTSSLAYDALYTATLYFSWSIICGGIIGLTTLPVKTADTRGGSLYFLVIAVVLLHVMIAFGSSIEIFNIVLHALCFVLSGFIALKVLNYCISKSAAFPIKNKSDPDTATEA